jgi:hypothetical protein
MAEQGRAAAARWGPMSAGGTRAPMQVTSLPFPVAEVPVSSIVVPRSAWVINW